MELITLVTFDNPIEAHMVKSKLESEEITCFLFDENMVTLYPLYNNTVGGIKLKINKKDEEKARKILLEFSNAKLLDDEANPIQCPKCKSIEIYSGFKSMKGSKGVLSAIVSFFFMVFPVYYKTLYKCKSCGKEFKLNKE